MAGQTSHGRLAALAVVGVLAASACASAGHETGMDNGSTPEPSKGPLVLDLEHREVVQSLASERADPAKQTYVRVPITDVHNPRRLRATFEVRYRASGLEDVLLGTFALYPPDRADSFIVATRGELRREGAVVLAMQVLDEVKPGDELRVTARALSFLEKGPAPTPRS